MFTYRSLPQHSAGDAARARNGARNLGTPASSLIPPSARNLKQFQPPGVHTCGRSTPWHEKTNNLLSKVCPECAVGFRPKALRPRRLLTGTINWDLRIRPPSCEGPWIWSSLRPAKCCRCGHAHTPDRGSLTLSFLLPDRGEEKVIFPKPYPPRLT